MIGSGTFFFIIITNKTTYIHKWQFCHKTFSRGIPCWERINWLHFSFLSKDYIYFKKHLKLVKVLSGLGKYLKWTTFPTLDWVFKGASLLLMMGAMLELMLVMAQVLQPNMVIMLELMLVIGQGLQAVMLPSMESCLSSCLCLDKVFNKICCQAWLSCLSYYQLRSETFFIVLYRVCFDLHFYLKCNFFITFFLKRLIFGTFVFVNLFSLQTREHVILPSFLYKNKI